MTAPSHPIAKEREHSRLLCSRFILYCRIPVGVEKP